jgi:hypothetical protein
MRVAQALAFAESCEEKVMDWAKCVVCGKGVLLPLSDYGPEGATIMFKAWVCSNRTCGYCIRIDKGQASTEFVQKAVKRDG